MGNDTPSVKEVFAEIIDRIGGVAGEYVTHVENNDTENTFTFDSDWYKCGLSDELLQDKEDIENAIIALVTFMHYAQKGYTLKRNGWHLRGLYRFSREDGVRAMLAGEAPF